jgi:hypothetical protein
MLQVTVARALPSDDVVLMVCSDDVVLFKKKCCFILDGVFLVKDMTEISRGQETRFIYILLS